eukprot:7286808-Prymnesium_polylepis.1
MQRQAPRVSGGDADPAARTGAVVPALLHGDGGEAGRPRRLAHLPRAPLDPVGQAGQHQVCRLGRVGPRRARRPQVGRAAQPAAAQRDDAAALAQDALRAVATA